MKHGTQLHSFENPNEQEADQLTVNTNNDYVSSRLEPGVTQNKSS